MKTNFDRYSIQARYFPVVISTLPLLITIIALSPSNSIGIGILTAFLTSAGVTAVLIQIGRDYGKKKEGNFNILFGGKATICMLRHKTSTINPITLERYHSKLSKSIRTKKPTSKYENSNPDECDIIYDSWIDWLRTKTRDIKKHNLVFEENINYGFRRNLWGIKSFGIVISIIGILLLIIKLILDFLNYHSISLYLVIIVIFNNLFLLFWIFCVTPKWVRLAANEYAKRLLEACEIL
jgi:hypothetical protein